MGQNLIKFSFGFCCLFLILFSYFLLMHQSLSNWSHFLWCIYCTLGLVSNSYKFHLRRNFKIVTLATAKCSWLVKWWTSYDRRTRLWKLSNRTINYKLGIMHTGLQTSSEISYIFRNPRCFCMLSRSQKQCQVIFWLSVVHFNAANTTRSGLIVLLRVRVSMRW